MPCSYPCLLDWNEQIWVSHIQFEIPPVSSRGVTSGLPSWWYWHSAAHWVAPKPCHLGLSAWLDPPVWHCLRNYDLRCIGLILPLRFAEGTVFWPLASCWHPEMTEFSLSDGAFPSLVAEGTELRCKKEACICGMSGLLGLM